MEFLGFPRSRASPGIPENPGDLGNPGNSVKFLLKPLKEFNGIPGIPEIPGILENPGDSRGSRESREFKRKLKGFQKEF